MHEFYITSKCWFKTEAIMLPSNMHHHAPPGDKLNFSCSILYTAVTDWAKQQHEGLVHAGVTPCYIVNNLSFIY